MLCCTERWMGWGVTWWSLFQGQWWLNEWFVRHHSQFVNKEQVQKTRNEPFIGMKAKDVEYLQHNIKGKQNQQSSPHLPEYLLSITCWIHSWRVLLTKQTAAAAYCSIVKMWHSDKQWLLSHSYWAASPCNLQIDWKCTICNVNT